MIGGSLVTCHSLTFLMHSDVIIPLNLRSTHFILMHDNRVIHSATAVYSLRVIVYPIKIGYETTLLAAKRRSKVNNSFSVTIEGKIVRILLNLLWCKQIMNILFVLRFVEWNFFIFHRMKLFLPLHLL